MAKRFPPLSLRIWNRLSDHFSDRVLHRNRSAHYLAHYINLEHRKDRDKKARTQFDAMGVPHQRFNACKFDPDHTTDYQRKILEREVAPYVHKCPERVQRGIIGCYISHISLTASLDPNDKRTQFIFEDDITFKSPLFFVRATRTLKKLPDDWEVCIFDSGGGMPDEDRLSHYIWKPKALTYMGAHALSINMKHRDRMLEKLVKHPVKDYDTLLTGGTSGVNVYIIQTSCVSVEWFNEDSDIRKSLSTAAVISS